MAFKSVKNFFFLQRTSAMLEGTTYKYSKIFFTSSPNIQAKKEHLLLRPGKSEFRTRAGPFAILMFFQSRQKLELKRGSFLVHVNVKRQAFFVLLPTLVGRQITMAPRAAEVHQILEIWRNSRQWFLCLKELQRKKNPGLSFSRVRAMGIEEKNMLW